MGEGIYVQTESWEMTSGSVAASDRESPPAPAPTQDDAEGKKLDFLLDQRQKLAQIYDDRRKDADSNATAVLGGAVAIVLLGVGSAQSQLEAHAVFAAIAIAAGVVSGTLAVLARSAGGLRPRPRTGDDATKRSWQLMRAALYGWRPGSTQQDDVGAISILSHESEDFRQAYGDLEQVQLPAGAHDAARTAALKLYRARAQDLHYQARAKERLVAVAGLVYAVSVVGLAVVGLVSILT